MYSYAYFGNADLVDCVFNFLKIHIVTSVCDDLHVHVVDILCSSASRLQAAEALAARLEAGKADILMLLQGAPVPSAEAAQLKSTLEKTYPRTEVILLDGGQPVYDYILVLC